MTVKCVAVHAGYVESSALGVVLFMHPEGFDTPAAAVRNLADGIFEKLDHDFSRYSKEQNVCCKKTLEKDSEAVYCSKCRNEIGEQEFDFDQHENDVAQLLGGTADSFGGNDIEDGDGGAWKPWNSISDVMELKPSEVVEISCYGERVLTAMISPERIPSKSRDAFQKWIRGSYFADEDRKQLGLPLYRS